MAEKHWVNGVVKHMKKGAFTKKADKAGMSVAAYAEKEAANPKAPAKTKREAVLAKTFEKMHNK